MTDGPDPVDEQAEAPPGAEAGPVEESETDLVSDLATAQSAVAALTDDLKRLQAEYVNYKRRVDRDRELVRQNAVFTVLTGLMPVLDDLDRAREHGELEGGFKAVADSLERIVAAQGLEKFGAPGRRVRPAAARGAHALALAGRHDHDVPERHLGGLPDRRARRPPGAGHRGGP